MTAKLTFNLPSDEVEFQDAINGNRYRAVIWEMDQYLRSQLKHQELTDEVQEKVQEIRDELHSIIDSHWLNKEQIWQ